MRSRKVLRNRLVKHSLDAIEHHHIVLTQLLAARVVPRVLVANHRLGLAARQRDELCGKGELGQRRVPDVNVKSEILGSQTMLWWVKRLLRKVFAMD